MLQLNQQLLSRLESGDIQLHWEDDEFVFHKEFSPVAQRSVSEPHYSFHLSWIGL